MSHKDRNRVQVPRELPDWMDGPVIRAKAKKHNCSYEAAKSRLLYDQHYNRLSKLLKKKR